MAQSTIIVLVSPKWVRPITITFKKSFLMDTNQSRTAISTENGLVSPAYISRQMQIDKTKAAAAMAINAYVCFLLLFIRFSPNIL